MSSHDTACVIEMVEEGMSILDAISLLKAYRSDTMSSANLEMLPCKTTITTNNAPHDMPPSDNMAGTEIQPTHAKQETNTGAEAPDSSIDRLDTKTTTTEELEQNAKPMIEKPEAVLTETKAVEICESSAKASKRKRA